MRSITTQDCCLDPCCSSQNKSQQQSVDGSQILPLSLKKLFIENENSSELFDSEDENATESLKKKNSSSFWDFKRDRVGAHRSRRTIFNTQHNPEIEITSFPIEELSHSHCSKLQFLSFFNEDYLTSSAAIKNSVDQTKLCENNFVAKPENTCTKLNQKQQINLSSMCENARENCILHSTRDTPSSYASHICHPVKYNQPFISSNPCQNTANNDDQNNVFNQNVLSTHATTQDNCCLIKQPRLLVFFFLVSILMFSIAGSLFYASKSTKSSC